MRGPRCTYKSIKKQRTIRNYNEENGSPLLPHRLVARGVELGLTISGVQTPVLLVLGLAVVTSGVGLPGLIVRLEVEEIDSPGQHSTDTVLPEGLRILGSSLGGLVVGASIY